MAWLATLYRPIVYPSGADFAIASAPTLPPEPPLLSTMNCWPVSSLSFWHTMRDRTSVGPPAGKELMYRTGLVGHSSAARAIPDASSGVASAPPANASARRREKELFMVGEFGLVRG